MKAPKVTIILLLCIFLPVCAGARGLPKKNKDYGGTLVWGVYHKPTLINPILATQSVSVSLEMLIFNSLIRLNAKGELEPDLAERWEVSPDGLVYTFYLRKGVRFHDGVECTAEDVKFTFDKTVDPEVNSPFRPLFENVREFKANGPHTFQVVLTQPDPAFIFRLIRSIIPKYALTDASLRDAAFNVKPIGTGPFTFKEWVEGSNIILEANPDYYEGRPFLDSIIVRSYADSRQAWTALMRQEVDLVLFIEKDDYEIVKDDPAFRAFAFPLDYYYAIMYNLDDPILADRRIRQAIALGVDRKNLITKIGLGYGLECNGPFYPESEGYNPEVKLIEFNPQKAAALLSEAGWKDIDDDGILEKEGKELEIRMLVDKRSDLYRKMAMLLRQDLQEIGIKLAVQWYENEKLLTGKQLEQNRTSAQLSLFLAGQIPEQIDVIWFSFGKERMNNLWPYDNAEVDNYLTQAKATPDKDEQELIYNKIHRSIYEDQPACFLYFPFCFHAASSRLMNIDELFTLSMPFQVMRKWSVQEKLQAKKERR